jgi:hypothetical protein
MKYRCISEGLFSVAALPVLALYWSSGRSDVDWVVRVPAAIAVCYILAQGSLYWALKYRQFQQGKELPAWFFRVYYFLRLSNAFVLCLVALAIAHAWWRGSNFNDLVWAAGLAAFAVLEHINYYYRQLMYDTASALNRLRKVKKLRRPMLAADLATADEYVVGVAREA